MKKQPYTLSECLEPYRKALGERAPTHAAMHRLRLDIHCAIDAANALRALKAASAESSQALRRVYYSSEVQSVLERLSEKSDIHTDKE